MFKLPQITAFPTGAVRRTLAITEPSEATSCGALVRWSAWSSAQSLSCRFHA